MKKPEKMRIAMDVVRAVLGSDREAYGELGIQLIQLSTGLRKRLNAGLRGTGKKRRKISEVADSAS